MINTILGIGIKFGACYLFSAIVIVAIIAIKVKYDTDGISGAFKEFLSICLTIIMFIAGIVCVGAAGAILANCWVALVLGTNKEFFMIIAVFGAIFVFFLSIGLICFYIFKKYFLIDFSTNKQQDEDLTYITQKEEEEIKDLVGGWYYWDRMSNKTKNEYIYQYRINGKIVR